MSPAGRCCGCACGACGVRLVLRAALANRWTDRASANAIEARALARDEGSRPSHFFRCLLHGTVRRKKRGAWFAPLNLVKGPGPRRQAPC